MTTVTLKASDGELFQVPEAVAMMMETIKVSLEFHSFTSSADSKDTITVPASSPQFALITSYLNEYVQAKDDMSTKACYDEFVKKMSMEEIVDMCSTASHLNVTHLTDWISQTIADHIDNKSVQYVRDFFGGA